MRNVMLNKPIFKIDENQWTRIFGKINNYEYRTIKKRDNK